MIMKEKESNEPLSEKIRASGYFSFTLYKAGEKIIIIILVILYIMNI